MQLFKKPKVFSHFFAKFLKSISNFENFGNKDEPHNFRISEIIDSERIGFLNI